MCLRAEHTHAVVPAAVVSLNSLAHGSPGSQLCRSAWTGGHISLRSLRIAPAAQRKPGLASWWPVLPQSCLSCPLAPACATVSSRTADPQPFSTGWPEGPRCMCVLTCLWRVPVRGWHWAGCWAHTDVRVSPDLGGRPTRTLTNKWGQPVWEGYCTRREEGGTVEGTAYAKAPSACPALSPTCPSLLCPRRAEVGVGALAGTQGLGWGWGAPG